ncbi:MAG: TIGR00341 family protein, partial [Thiogranum sp.]
MKLIEVVADPGQLDVLVSFVAEQHGALDYWYSEIAEDQRQSIRMLVDDENRQSVLDTLQNLLGNTENVRILVLPVEAVLPRPVEQETPKAAKKTSTGSTREELYSQIEKNTRLDGNYLILVLLSTVVAAIGLLENNVSV